MGLWEKIRKMFRKEEEPPLPPVQTVKISPVQAIILARAKREADKVNPGE